MFQHLDIYVKLFLLPYADDTILMSETETGLQDALNYFHQYCIQWKLEVNASKIKITVFKKRKSSKSYPLHIMVTYLKL